jgi:2',3'-cyclic-nucleotide 2'-phosphodiesterase (5'-nucleotidase family)
MPFDNQLVRLRLTGKELGLLLLSNLTQSAHGLLSVSGVTTEVECQGSTRKLAVFRPNGARVRDDETLTVATNDFLAYGGDGLLASIKLGEGRIEIAAITVFDALAEGLAKRRHVEPDQSEWTSECRPH